VRFCLRGRQHFAALRYGYETQNLRRERDQLAEQQRRLILQREEAASPVKLEQAAKRLGIANRCKRRKSIRCDKKPTCRRAKC
jgi:hypothetical protein